jgi:hypothetical protein
MQNCHKTKWLALMFLYLAFSLTLYGCSNSIVNDTIPTPTNSITKFDRTDGFDIAYSYTFYLDVCGEKEFGESIRRAIFAKVTECPFSDLAKNHFVQLAKQNTSRYQNDLAQYILKHRENPKSLLNGKMSCSNFLKGQNIEKQRDTLSQYTKGKISLEKVFLGTCEEGGSTFVR